MPAAINPAIVLSVKALIRMPANKPYKKILSSLPILYTSNFCLR